MALELLLALVLGGISGIAVLLHLTGRSRQAVLGVETARTAWLRHFPEDSVLRVLPADGGQAALVLTSGGPGLLWAFGADTVGWLKYFLVGTVFLMGLAIINAALPQASILALVIALAGPWAMGWHMAWQLRGFDPNSSEKMLRLFRANRDTGLIPLICLVIALLV